MRERSDMQNAELVVDVDGYGLEGSTEIFDKIRGGEVRCPSLVSVRTSLLSSTATTLSSFLAHKHVISLLSLTAEI